MGPTAITLLQRLGAVTRNVLSDEHVLTFILVLTIGVSCCNLLLCSRYKPLAALSSPAKMETVDSLTDDALSDVDTLSDAPTHENSPLLDSVESKCKLNNGMGTPDPLVLSQNIEESKQQPVGLAWSSGIELLIKSPESVPREHLTSAKHRRTAAVAAATLARLTASRANAKRRARKTTSPTGCVAPALH